MSLSLFFLRRYRNRRIGEFLKKLDLTEGRATGTPKILRAMKENGSPPPEFEFDKDHTYFLVRLPVHPEARMEVEQDAGEITPPVMRLLNLLAAKGPKGNADIREEFGLKDRVHLRKLYIDPALRPLKKPASSGLSLLSTDRM